MGWVSWWPKCPEILRHWVRGVSCMVFGTEVSWIRSVQYSLGERVCICLFVQGDFGSSESSTGHGIPACVQVQENTQCLQHRRWTDIRCGKFLLASFALSHCLKLLEVSGLRLQCLGVYIINQLKLPGKDTFLIMYYMFYHLLIHNVVYCTFLYISVIYSFYRALLKAAFTVHTLFYDQILIRNKIERLIGAYSKEFQEAAFYLSHCYSIAWDRL